jgi:hypothetical protein
MPDRNGAMTMGEIADAWNKDKQRIAKLEAAIREHRDSFSHDMDELDWTTEDETLWAMVQEKPE